MIETAQSVFRSAPTIAMPRGRPPRAPVSALQGRAPVSAPQGRAPVSALQGRAPRPAPDESGVEVLTSADFLISGPLSSSRGGGPASRDQKLAATPAVDPLVGRILADRYRIVEP